MPGRERQTRRTPGRRPCASGAIAESWEPLFLAGVVRGMESGATRPEYAQTAGATICIPRGDVDPPDPLILIARPIVFRPRCAEFFGRMKDEICVVLHSRHR